MGRRPIERMVMGLPPVRFFKPQGMPLRMLEIVNLTVDECEAIRLADLEGLEQEEGGKKMGVSRQTFARVLKSARNKIADALVSGKAIRIEGGNYALPPVPPASIPPGWVGGGRRWRGGRG